jgi:hypothetical protein
MKASMRQKRFTAHGLVPLCLVLLFGHAFQEPVKDRSSAGKQICVNGRIWLAKAPEKVRFSFTCGLTGPAKAVRLSIVRFSTKEPHAGSGIHGVSTRLRLGGAGNDGGRGSCVLQKEDASCVVRAPGRVRASGWIDVGLSERCKRRVALSVTRPTKCYDDRCEAVLDVDYLWKRVPVGC